MLITTRKYARVRVNACFLSRGSRQLNARLLCKHLYVEEENLNVSLIDGSLPTPTPVSMQLICAITPDTSSQIGRYGG